MSITPVSPLPSTPPGAVGGFSLLYALARGTPIQIDVADASLAATWVSVYFLDGTVELAYRSSNFVAGYLARSKAVVTGTTTRFYIYRDEGWPGASRLGNLAVGIGVDTVDSGGARVSSTAYYQLPDNGEGFPVVPAPIAPGAMDVIAGALGRLVWQLRSGVL